MRSYLFIVVGLFLILSTGASAQQDPMFTKYMFNPLQYNPGYAGSRDALSLTLLHRHQWWNIEGAPITQSFTMHSPMKDDRLALGMNLSFDQIGASQQVGAFVDYAYRIPVGPKARFSIGVQGGIHSLHTDWSKVDFKNGADIVALQGLADNLLLPNFGAGLYYNSENFYVGFSAPYIIDNKLRKLEEGIESVPDAQQYRHYYLTAGLAMNLSSSTVFRPSILWKNVGLFGDKNAANSVGAPNELDIDLAFLFLEKLWLGAAFRTALEEGESSYDSVDFMFAYMFRNGLRLGVAYDHTLSALQGNVGGTYEILVGYDFNFSKSQIIHVRYF